MTMNSGDSFGIDTHTSSYLLDKKLNVSTEGLKAKVRKIDFGREFRQLFQARHSVKKRC